MPNIKANGIQLEYDERGDGDPLVLIMGIGAQMIFWPEGFCDALANAGFRVIRFDNRDCGLSQRLTDAPRIPMWPAMAKSVLGWPIDAPYTLTDMADDVVGLLDALDIESAHIVGASMGGMIAQTTAIVHPHRTRSLTSIMSHTGERRWLLGAPRSVLKLLARPPKDRAGFIEHQMQLTQWISGTFPHQPDKVRARLELAYDRGLYPPGFIRQLLAILASGSRKDALRFVRTPALVIHGSEDPLLLIGGGRATARALPNARLEIIEGMGHDLPEPVWPTIIQGIAAMRPKSS